MIGITVLGATGSIGISTLDVLSRHKDKYKVIAITANKQVDKLFAQCQQHLPEYAVMADADSAQKLQDKLIARGLYDITVLSGATEIEKVAVLERVDYVMAAIVGAIGLMPALAAAAAGKRVLLANKEALVLSGQIFIDKVKESKAVLLPIDSEHNAIFQCMPHLTNESNAELGISKILLTASGGPFRNSEIDTLHYVTPAQACAHPNWDMGRKISIDSATMMNKGLEVIEARWLFDVAADDIDVVVHPQSIIHSLVEYVDGSVLAQLGNPDMRTPIAHALAWPNRIESGVTRLNLAKIAHLDFQEPDYMRFPCLRLAFDCLRIGGTSTAILNAANEVAVAEFLDETISFTNIPKVIEATLEELSVDQADTLEKIMSSDEQARHIAMEHVKRLGFNK